MNTRKRYGMYLEISGPGGDARATSLCVTRQQRDELVREFSSAFPVTTPLARVVERLGTPQRSHSDAIQYDLEVRKGLVFEFQTTGNPALVAAAGYVHLEARACPVAITKPKTRQEAKELGEALLEAGATAPELRRWLGGPNVELGWWPHETWCYGEYLSLELRLGVVEAWSNDPEAKKALTSE